MLKALTVSQAKPRLGDLLDRAGNGESVYLRRKKRLYRIEPVENRPRKSLLGAAKGRITFRDDLANSAPAFPPRGKPRLVRDRVSGLTITQSPKGSPRITSEAVRAFI